MQPSLVSGGTFHRAQRPKLRTNPEREKCPRLSMRINSFFEKLSHVRPAQREQRFEAKLKRQAKQLGYELVPIEPKAA
jgi:hypothetical protein